MTSKYTGKTFIYYIKKTIRFFKEKINNLFSKKYSKIHLVTDGASWAVDTSTYDILNYYLFGRQLIHTIVTFSREI